MSWKEATEVQREDETKSRIGIREAFPEDGPVLIHKLNNIQQGMCSVLKRSFGRCAGS